MLLDDAARLAERLTAVNEALFERARRLVVDERLRGATLRAYFARFEPTLSSGNAPTGEGAVHTSYGALDLLADGLFALNRAPAPTVALAPEMVPCEETPVLAILDLVDQLDFGPDDRFYDLGCGLGQVVMLVHLLSGVAACGIEIEPRFVGFARQQVRALGLDGVSFMHGDVQEAALDDGTVFFLFTPFRGDLLRRVLARLHAVAQDHPIRVCTFGPCTPIVADEPWLKQRTDEIPHEYKLTVFETMMGCDGL